MNNNMCTDTQMSCMLKFTEYIRLLAVFNSHLMWSFETDT